MAPDTITLSLSKDDRLGRRDGSETGGCSSNFDRHHKQAREVGQALISFLCNYRSDTSTFTAHPCPVHFLRPYLHFLNHKQESVVDLLKPFHGSPLLCFSKVFSKPPLTSEGLATRSMVPEPAAMPLLGSL